MINPINYPEHKATQISAAIGHRFAVCELGGHGPPCLGLTAVMQQFFLANARCEPRIEFLLCKHRLPERIGLAQFTRQLPFFKVAKIYRVLAKSVCSAPQCPASRSVNYDVVSQIMISHCKLPSPDQRVYMLNGCPIMPCMVKGKQMYPSKSMNACRCRSNSMHFIGILGAVLDHEEPLPHPASDQAIEKHQARIAPSLISYGARPTPAALPSWFGLITSYIEQR
jgi:hypothetical protein